MLETYSVCKYNKDVWHDGRFLDTWADEIIKEALPECFAHYNKTDMISALYNTKKLFVQLAKETAEMNNFNYPEIAINYAGHLLSEYFDI